ncbi:helix-turn-helix domain-containing protein [Streptomyces goshikiensis]|uniref:helix-turn-helix domain-containing protein n=1 Tax=Streptomyces goshikiensis TaxID=1942 RepID=UPI0033BF24E8
MPPSLQQQQDRQAQHRLAVLRHAEEVTGNVALTCRYYGISRTCFYKWLRRYQDEGLEGLRGDACPRRRDSRGPRSRSSASCRDPGGGQTRPRVVGPRRATGNGGSRGTPKARASYRGFTRAVNISA